MLLNTKNNHIITFIHKNALDNVFKVKIIIQREQTTMLIFG